MTRASGMPPKKRVTVTHVGNPPAYEEALPPDYSLLFGGSVHASYNSEETLKRVHDDRQKELSRKIGNIAQQYAGVKTHLGQAQTRLEEMVLAREEAFREISSTFEDVKAVYPDTARAIRRECKSRNPRDFDALVKLVDLLQNTNASDTPLEEIEQKIREYERSLQEYVDETVKHVRCSMLANTTHFLRRV